MSYPRAYDQAFYASVDQVWNLGAITVGATIYFGSPASTRQIQEVSKAFTRVLKEGVKLFHLIQGVYLSDEVTISSAIRINKAKETL